MSESLLNVSFKYCQYYIGLYRRKEERKVECLISFCVSEDFVVTIESSNRKLPRYFDAAADWSAVYDESDSFSDSELTSNDSVGDSSNVSSINVFNCATGAFLYSIRLGELSYDYDRDDQPVRLFHLRENSVLLVIERDNFEKPVSAPSVI